MQRLCFRGLNCSLLNNRLVFNYGFSVTFSFLLVREVNKLFLTSCKVANPSSTFPNIPST
ncbi:MAG: hypothetical protein CL555_02930 [Algoriphagus sp.]|nr:hypothetical protein [Algoriphagus sp.]